MKMRTARFHGVSYNLTYQRLEFLLVRWIFIQRKWHRVLHIKVTFNHRGTMTILLSKLIFYYYIYNLYNPIFSQISARAVNNLTIYYSKSDNLLFKIIIISDYSSRKIESVKSVNLLIRRNIFLFLHITLIKVNFEERYVVVHVKVPRRGRRVV